MLRSLPILGAALFSCLLAACSTTSSSSDPRSAQELEYRRLSIASEPRGDYYIGRRFHIERTHFWGYVRRPGETWDKSRLVVLNEKFQRAPDRLPEIPSGMGPAYGYDHNYQYRLWGHFSGRKVYDPNSNLILPEFVLQRYELITESPGWLFKPGERFDGRHLLRHEPGAVPGGR
jgi:hypothetical protein